MKTIETERLALRALRERDAEDLFACFGDDSVTKHMCTATVGSVDDERRLLVKFIADGAMIWAIEVKDTGMVAGTIGLSQINENDKTAQVGYALSKAYWGKGIASEALRAVLEYGLLEFGLNRIEAVHSVDNPASGGVMRKAGMLYEGMAREKFRNRLGYHDCHMYGILKRDL